jgi:3-oxoacyl-[acyl-carrier protein] reductase
MHTVKNSLTFVSGSTQGIGLAIARAFVENRAQVVVHGRTEAKSCEAAGVIGAFAAVWGDLSSTEGANDVLAQLERIGAVVIVRRRTYKTL